jgi:transcriptional regulator with XRE-family HTH domain
MRLNPPSCHPVANHPLPNYLRTHRRRKGLSQGEVAALLGAASGTKVSRYENFARRPAATTVFALEIIFNEPANKLFAGAYEEVRLAVRARAELLVKELAKKTPKSRALRTVRKLEFLRAIVEAKLPTTPRA